MPKSKRISDIDKNRLYKCFCEGRDYQILASDLEIKKTSALNIIRTMQGRKGVASLPSGGAHHIKVDNDMRQELEFILGEYPSMSLKEINVTLRARLPNKPEVTDTCISNAINGMMYSLKKVVNQPFERNSDATKNARREYVTWYLNNAYTGVTIFIDEAGINLWTHRTRGRYKIGTPAVRIVGGQRGRNLTLIMSTSKCLGLVHSKVQFGGTNIDRFQTFIDELSEKLRDVNKVFFIMDNATCHNVTSHNEQHFLKKLPPYSPALNPVEEAFSCWKYAVKAKLSEQQVRIMDTVSATGAGKSMVEWRGDILQEIAVECLSVITVDKCSSWDTHMIKMLAKCNNFDDI